MKNLILIFDAERKNSMQASIYIARYLESVIKDSKLHFGDTLPLDSTWDSVILVNGATGMSLGSDLCNKISGFIYKNCGQAVWVSNDYKITPFSQLKNWPERNGMDGKYKSLNYWSSMREPVPYLQFKRFEESHHYVNWNCLSILRHSRWKMKHERENAGMMDLFKPERDLRSVLYYGANREGRLKSFQRYMCDPRITWSAPYESKLPKFTQCKVIPKFQDLYGMLGIYTASLYLEDEASHRIYCSPANRFYECLCAGVAQYFDSSCSWTFQQSGIDIDKYIVRSPEDLIFKANGRTLDAREQRENWDKREMLLEFQKQLGLAIVGMGMKFREDVLYERA